MLPEEHGLVEVGAPEKGALVFVNQSGPIDLAMLENTPDSGGPSLLLYFTRSSLFIGCFAHFDIFQAFWQHCLTLCYQFMERRLQRLHKSVIATFPLADGVEFGFPAGRHIRRGCYLG